MGAGLLRRLLQAYREWRQERRDAAAVRAFQRGNVSPSALPEGVSPMARLTMLLLARFLGTDVEAVELSIVEFRGEASAILPGKMPLYVAVYLARQLDALEGETRQTGEVVEKKAVIRSSQGLRTIWVRSPRPWSKEALRDAIRQNTELLRGEGEEPALPEMGPLAVVAKTPLVPA